MLVFRGKILSEKFIQQVLNLMARCVDCRGNRDCGGKKTPQWSVPV